MDGRMVEQHKKAERVKEKKKNFSPG